MNKILRDSVDIAVAFDSYQKRLASQVGSAASPTEAVVMSEPAAMSSTQASMSPAKAIARKVAQIAYRLLKPFVRPVAFRARRFLLDPLRNELLQEMQRLSLEVAQEVQKASASTVKEVQKASASTVKEVQKASVSTVQEVLTSAATNRQALVAHNNALLPRLDRIELYSAATARRVAIPCEAGEILIRTEVGFVLCASSDHALIASLVENGELETGTRRLIQRYLKPGDSFVDVGANIGMHALAAARAMHGKGDFIAFEPFEQTARMLEKSLWMNGFSQMATVHHAAVSSEKGFQHLYLGGTSGHHSLFDHGTSSKLERKSVEVSLTTLDLSIAEKDQVTLLKIDAEGAELDIIAGGNSLLTSNPDIALIVEFGPSHLRRIGISPDKWLDCFKELGFDFRAINEVTGDLETMSQMALEKVDSVNLFFARPDSSAWSRVS
ncbi:MAG: FkbM family methyltransferase [Pseudomonadota bacterium]